MLFYGVPVQGAGEVLGPAPLGHRVVAPSGCRPRSAEDPGGVQKRVDGIKDFVSGKGRAPMLVFRPPRGVGRPGQGGEGTWQGVGGGTHGTEACSQTVGVSPSPAPSGTSLVSPGLSSLISKMGILRGLP